VAGADAAAIDRFVVEMREEIELTRKANSTRHHVDQNRVTEGRAASVDTNTPSVNARVAALNAACAAADALRFALDPKDTPAALDALRLAIPPLKFVTVVQAAATKENK
jgi:hypothetical protein